jgi:hypothetical protein
MKVRVQKFALLLLAGLAMPAFAIGETGVLQHVTAEQLEQILATAHDKPDKNLKRQLNSLRLSERLSAVRLAQAEAGLPGPASRKALISISDEAGFLDLPAHDLPATTPPDKTTQVAMLTLIVKYVNQTTNELPNFFATRETTRFETEPWAQTDNPEQAIAREPLLPLETSSVTVFYRDGREVQQSSNGKKTKVPFSQFKLETHGEFGPILTTVIGDALHGKMTWGHWEQGPLGLMAVFRYSVAREFSRYAIFYPDSGKGPQEFPAYHGEIATNPVDGSILRITLLADFHPSSQNVRADLLVEYGSVEIGNRKYICPVKSVALSEVRVPNKYYGFDPKLAGNTNIFRMRVNDMRFTRYHMFRSEMRLLPAYDAATESPLPTSSPDGVPAAEPAKVSRP